MAFPWTEDPREGWEGYSRHWEEEVRGGDVRVLGDEWLAPAEVDAIWERFGAPHLGPGADALEIGPGGGKWSRRIAARSRSFTAADIAPAMLARTRALLGDGPARRYVLLGGHGWPELDDAAFHFLWAFDVLVHLDLEDLWLCMQETRRVLRPGGTAVLHVADLTTDPGFDQFRREAAHASQGFRLFSRLRFVDDAMARRLLREAGLEIVDGNLAGGRRELARRDLLYVVRRSGT